MRAAYTVLSLSLVVSLGAAAIAAALDPVVRQRQADMKAMSAAAKSISEFFSERKPYQPREFKTQARLIAELGGEALIGHFSLVTRAEGSEAREEIGVEREKFTTLARDRAVYARHASGVGLALENGRRSVELDGEDPWGHLALGFVHMLSRRSRAAIDELEEAVWLNPNFALGYIVLGTAHGFVGTGDEGLQHLVKAMRLSPRDPHQSLYQSACALCYFVTGRYEESIILNRRAVQLRPRFTSAWRTHAAAAGTAGDADTATVALAEVQRLQPELSADWVEKHHPLVRPEDRAIYIEGLRKAGLG